MSTRSLFCFCLIMVFGCNSENQKQPMEVDVIKMDSVVEELVTDENISVEVEPRREGWIEITADKYTKLDLRYATDNNFVDEQMYDCGRCYIREEAYDALQKVREALITEGYGIVLYDCYRPKPVQQKLWNKVPNASYVTPPSRGSMHNRGVALDIGLIDSLGSIIDMGTEFDYFGREGHHDYYDHPQEVLDHRKLLKTTMEQHNFASIRTEWWHYSYVIGEYEIADWQWDCQ